MPSKMKASDVVSVEQRFRNFWRALQVATGGRAAPIDDRALLVELSDHDSVVVQTPKDSGSLALLGLSARQRLSRRADLDVYLQFYQRLVPGEGDQYLLDQSNIRVLYLEARAKQGLERELSSQIQPAYVFHGFHFDYAKEKNHPIFHVQSAQSITQNAVRRRISEAPRRRCEPPRIPTPPLDLAGVVYMVLHDHLPEVVNKGWPNELGAAAARLPRFPLESFDKYLKPAAQMQCPWWYEHAGHMPS